jgi:glycerol uptake facilitator-like aquaporin
MRDSWRHFVAEFIGTFALVFVGGAAIMLAKDTGSPSGLLEIALAHGLILAVMVSALMRISGHFNPAVTLGFLVTKRIDPLMAGVYIIAQVMGSILGAYFLKWTFPFGLFDVTHGGGQSLRASGERRFRASALEAVASRSFWFSQSSGLSSIPKAPRIGGLGIGFVVAADILALRSANWWIDESRALVRAGNREVDTMRLSPSTGFARSWVESSPRFLYDYLFIKRDLEPVDHGVLKPLAIHERHKK